MVSEPLIRIASGLEPTTADWNRKPAGQLILLLLLLLIFAREHRAASLPPGFSEEALEGPWTEPVGLTFESEQKSSNGRAYIWERTGKVWIFENGAKQSPPLIDISEEVGGWRDHGLLGFALHPRFRDNGYIFLAYTVDHHHLTKFGTSNYHS
ncbi:MAG: PQQ-dependent sugar dehydrogenase, partial [Verrucomicrobia bacterium]|nr:PQQ-dependent sugar dehydrogenase [Verrucomicrobiota bacterium]